MSWGDHEAEAWSIAGGVPDVAPARARVEPERLLRALRLARARRLALTLDGTAPARSR